jgi:hypothetical protein
MNKSRKLGWNGFVDTGEGILSTIKELGELKMAPPFEMPAEIDVKYLGY